MRHLLAFAGAALLAGCMHEGTIVTHADAPPPAIDAGLAGNQYLYGSGEGAAVSVQAWNALVAHAAAATARRPVDSVVLAPGATLAAPSFVPCGDKPLAAVFDVDETVLLNLGWAYDAAGRGGGFDRERWGRWEREGMAAVAPVPGAREGIAALRRMGVTVIYNTNRSAANAAGSEAALNAAGLGPARHGDTLFLQGDDATGPRKDGRRATIAARWCVVALGGDQLGDFSDLFNERLDPAARRAATTAPAIARLWGAGWFALPNPTYGTALKGDRDTLFPAATRWTPKEPN